jgi:plasmid stabilization system protein ParE
MDYSILLSANAKNRLLEIIDYYDSVNSLSYGKKLIRELVKETKRLHSSPYIGPKELLLIDRQNTYRYLIFKDYKIIYTVHIETSTILIADVFDTRQNPEKLESIR